MTAPLDDDSRPGVAGRRGIGRELLGLLLVVVGILLAAAVLASVDWRLTAGFGAIVLIAGGLLLGRVPDDEGE